MNLRLPMALKKAAWAILVTSMGLASPASATTDEARDAACGAILKESFVEFRETPSTYAFLRELDEARCPPIPRDDFEAFVDGRSDVNLVSYYLLESRLLDDSDHDREEMIALYVEAYLDVSAELDELAILPLIDAVYYGCEGDASCIGESVLDQTENMPLSPVANCLYGMPGVCSPVEVTMPLPLLNDASLALRASPEDAFAERTQFICRRYFDCPQ